jgi:hypothetical protein
MTIRHLIPDIDTLSTANADREDSQSRGSNASVEVRESIQNDLDGQGEDSPSSTPSFPARSREPPWAK